MAKKYQGRFEKKTRSGRGVWLLLLLTLLSMTGIGTAAAKYLQGTEAQNIVHAPEFYFTSNRLAEDNPKYGLNSDVTTITFTLSNKADDLRVSECDVNYTVTVEDDDEDNDATLEGTASGTMTAGTAQTLTLTLTDMEPGQTYTVTATGSNGYSQTLQATFTVAGNDENVYMHTDTSNEGYVLLTVWTHNVTGDLTVTYPAGLIPDNTDSVMSGVYNYSEGAYQSGTFADTSSFGTHYSSRTYRFFRSGEVAGSFEAFISNSGTTYEAKEATP